MDRHFQLATRGTRALLPRSGSYHLFSNRKKNTRNVGDFLDTFPALSWWTSKCRLETVNGPPNLTFVRNFESCQFNFVIHNNDSWNDEIARCSFCALVIFFVRWKKTEICNAELEWMGFAGSWIKRSVLVYKLTIHLCKFLYCRDVFNIQN